jgi:hypothetical protein
VVYYIDVVKKNLVGSVKINFLTYPTITAYQASVKMSTISVDNMALPG